MKISVIACRIFNREISEIVYKSNNIVEVYWLEQGLHNTPDLLRQKIQSVIDEIDAKQKDLHNCSYKSDAIVLAYGLCSNAIIGLSSKSLPLIAPKCDDCIALFLGSQKRYLELFHIGGVYWYNNAWMENASLPSQELEEQTKTIYSELYGEDNAEFLLEAELGWKTNYKNLIYINSKAGSNEKFKQRSKQAANYFKWNFLEHSSDMSMLERMLNGVFCENEVLILEPFETIVEEFTENKISKTKK